MERYLKKYTLITSFIAAILFCNHAVAQENEADNYKMAFSFRTEKNNDNARVLEANFIGRNKNDKKDILPIFGAEIKFFNILNDDEVLLGTSKTTNKGIAQLIIPENHNYLIDPEGNINLIARFEATEYIEEESEEIIVKNLHLELIFTEVDSVKTVLIKAFTLDSLGIETPAEEVDFIVFIKTMLSKMPIIEGTIENGEFEFEFPADFPGDKNGDLTVSAQVEDHDEYASVTQEKTVNWGVFSKEIKKGKNTLWSAVAPIWMYTVLTIMLVGVWANYLYTIVHLFKIKKEGDQLKQTDES
ncbi:MAG: hypothetical protein IBX66_05400 [Lutibacter sp.]|nr:hypothetical protein [Lutibacter sp.]